MEEYTFGNSPAARDLYSMVKHKPYLRRRFSNWIAEMSISMKDVARMKDKRTKVITALLIRNWFLNVCYDYQHTLVEEKRTEYKTIFDHYDNVITMKYREACRDMGLIPRSEKRKKPTAEVSDKCPKCGYDWEAHEFAVPAPYCPANDENAEENRKCTREFQEKLKRMRGGK